MEHGNTETGQRDFISSVCVCVFITGSKLSTSYGLYSWYSLSSLETLYASSRKTSQPNNKAAFLKTAREKQLSKQISHTNTWYTGRTGVPSRILFKQLAMQSVSLTMDNRKRRHSELQHSSRRAGQVLTVWFVWIEVKAVAMTMAQKIKRPTLQHLLPWQPLVRMCCLSGSSSKEGGGQKGKNKKKCRSSYNKRHHFDAALKGKQIRRLQETSRGDYFCSSRFINMHVWFFGLQS